MEVTMKSRTITRTIKDPKLLGPFIAPRNEDEYDTAVEVLNQLVDEIGDHPEDPRYRLIETLSALVEVYDAEHRRMPDVSGIDVLRFLIEQHDLNQADLPEVGTQSVVSEVLSGRRQLNVRQIQELAARFGVNASAFLGPPHPRPRIAQNVP
jgi:HTH-type transcriptional regulator/antitoxin HigA